MRSEVHQPKQLSDVADWIGSPQQLVQLRELKQSNGQAAGQRLVQLQNAAGVQLDVLPDRSLDIGAFSHRGVPLVWASATGLAGAGAGLAGADWLRGFGGGLLSTCGLDSFGPGSEDEYGTTSQHGVIGTQPATLTRQETTDTELVVAATVRQVRVFGEDLELNRTISLPIGEPVVRIRDEVTNRADRDWPFMVLYHMNFGWPLVSPEASIRATFTSSEPRDEEAERGLEEMFSFQEPTPGYDEQVFLHHQPAGNVWNTVAVENPALGIAVEVRTRGDQLPYLHQWKMMGRRNYALGLEPSNCQSMSGRAQTLLDGLAPMLAPGETRVHELEVHVQDLATPAQS